MTHNRGLVPVPLPWQVNDLLARFVVNLPATEHDDECRLMFHVERAFWFYLDHRCVHLSANDRIHWSNDQGEFLRLATAMLDRWRPLVYSPARLAKMLCDYRAYKKRIPVAGCALVRLAAKPSKYETCLIRPPHTDRWTFPRGKSNRGETLPETALRETPEETGYCVRPAALTSMLKVGAVHLFPVLITPNTCTYHDKHRSSSCWSEVAEMKWFPLDEPPPLLTAMAAMAWPKVLAFAKSAMG